MLEKDKIEYLPPAPDVFNCFRLVPKREVRVVIVGQSAYHTPGLAHGLAFSCLKGIPPSLKTIYTELARTVDGFKIPAHGNLSVWCTQGVLLLNVSPTAQKGVADYKPKLWMSLIEAVITGLMNMDRYIVWMLWGQKAQALTKIIGDKGIKLLAAHPSPLNTRGGFVGCGHFVECNTHLIKRGRTPIDWKL
jgi:uracil-DNA glycosylase